jgi:peptide/nickel transport system ATP-binding protein
VTAVEPLLRLDGLDVRFDTPTGDVHAVRGMSYEVAPGECLVVVGESGSGKSVSALAVLGLLPAHQATVTGSARFEGRELLGMPERELRRIRGGQIGMVFQDPQSSLNPVLTIGRQLAEGLGFHAGLRGAAADARVVELLQLVGIPDARRRVDDYPHQFSGGMRQRVMLAMAVSCNPRLLIADEPTTALDVTIQAQMLELLRRLGQELSTALVLITHDLGVAAGFADRIAVAYAGRIVETGPATEVLAEPRHPYTGGLLASLPRIDQPRTARLKPIEGAPPTLSGDVVGCPFRPRCALAVVRCATEEPPLRDVASARRAACWLERPAIDASLAPPATAAAVAAAASTAPLLEVHDLRVWFPLHTGVLRRRTGWVRAVDGVDLRIDRRETLGLVGESGSGKSTLARAVARLLPTTSGRIALDGRDLLELRASELRGERRRFQYVFQDPLASLNPRQTAGAIVAEPLLVHHLMSRREAAARVADLLAQVGLDAAIARRYAHEMSGGQRQRIAIARALALEPDLIICDEPVTALDVSVQAQVVNLLRSLQDDLGLSYLFIAHDLSVVRHLAHRVAVMYLGHIVETAPVEALFTQPLHPYTHALLSAAPIPDPVRERKRRRILLTGETPSAAHPPAGCAFSSRCWRRRELGDPDVCTTTPPPLTAPGEGDHVVACHFADSTTTRTGAAVDAAVPSA